ncbi:NAD(P)-binding protein [Neoconidiobolus thromboides FSU 785]|nr:NAD(P)-binding protein [Neoconidiobolus thromboides FSU 785]
MQEESIKKAVNGIIAAEGKIDILINNAGVSVSKPIIEVDITNVNKVFETNVFGVLNLTQAVVPHMINNKSGTIVNIGSISGHMTAPFGAVYGASKSAIHTLSETLRLELAPFNIDVLTIKPGSVKSKIDVNNLMHKEEKSESLYDSIYGYIVKRANYSQTHSPMSADDFSNQVIHFIESKRSTTLSKFYFYINPFAVIISALAYLTSLLVPSLKPSLSFFNSYKWPYSSVLVLGGDMWVYYGSRLLPSFIIDYMIWSMFGLGQLAYILDHKKDNVKPEAVSEVTVTEDDKKKA